MRNEGHTQSRDDNPFAGSKFRVNGDDSVAKHLTEARGYAARYLSAQIGRARLVLRNLLLLSILGILALIVLATFAVVAVVLLCNGVAGGIGALLGNRPWAGDLIVGLAVLGGAVAMSWVAASKIRTISRQKALAGYLKPKGDI